MVRENCHFANTLACTKLCDCLQRGVSERDDNIEGAGEQHIQGVAWFSLSHECLACVECDGHGDLRELRARDRVEPFERRNRSQQLGNAVAVQTSMRRSGVRHERHRSLV